MLNYLKRPTRSDIVRAYSVLLGRAPESETIIEHHRSVGSLMEVIENITRSQEFRQRNRDSPFYHYQATFDAEGTIRRHAATKLKPHPAYLTNFLGVLIDPKFFPEILAGRAGEVEPFPIPANWHADIAEWAAVLRSIDLARSAFTVAELGCGWGCWINNAGVAARRAGLAVQAIGVEGDEGHVAFAKEACEVNGYSPGDVSIRRGVAAATSGVALFPRQETAGIEWGLEPIFNADAETQAKAIATGSCDVVQMIPLSELLQDRRRLDLLHIDIQGGEANLIHGCLPILNSHVAYLVIGTHSREIEGSLFADLLGAGWRLEVERPAILSLQGGTPQVVVDGVQGWRNLRLLPQ